MAGSMDLRLMNQVIGGCLRLLARSLDQSLFQGYSWGNIDRSFLGFQSSSCLSVSTFGISRNVHMRGIGSHSVRKAFKQAHKNNLLGLRLKDDPNIGGRLSGIAFVTAPKGVDPGLVKHVIQESAGDIWDDVSYEVKEVFVSTDSQITTFDVVVWFGGQITPPVLRSIIAEDDQVHLHIEDRLEVFSRQLGSCEGYTTEFFEQAKRDFYHGLDLVEHIMRRM